MSATFDQDRPAQPDDAQAKTIARLERRLERERRARRDAEEIADRGMRDLWLANQSLDARVGERTADLESTLEKLRVASSARERFLATLSHEMRTPLNGILGMLELLAPHIDDGQSQTYLGTAQESAERLHQLLARLLDLVELDSGTLRSNSDLIDVGQLGDGIRERWQLQLMHRGQLLSVVCFAEGETVEVDAGRVDQIVDELLHNVASHGSPGSVRVELTTGDDQLTVTVRDSGPGIDPDLIENLFDDFSMLDDTTARAQQGMGLGLGLCRRIAIALGGALDMSSDGTTHTLATLAIEARAHHPATDLG